MTASAKGKLIAFRSDRLGARLVSLMNAMRLAEDYDVFFQCAWIDSIGVGHVFNDPTEMFDADFVDRHFLTADEWKLVRPGAETLTGALQQRPDSFQKILASGQDVIVGNAFGVIILRGEDADDVTERFRRQFNRIPFAVPVAEAMRTLESALAGHTAYHIRRGDLTDDPKAKHKLWAHKVVPNEFYEWHMDRTLSDVDGGAIVFSDDADSMSHYKAKFPSIKTIDDVVDMKGLTEAQRDLFELFAMSRCKTIIAPPRSAFSSTAADLTGAKKLSITEAMDDDLIEQAHEALYHRLEHDADSFDGDGHISQALAHIANWLEPRGEWERAARLFRLRIADGLNISFIYPMAMRLMHHANDIDGVLDTATFMRERTIFQIKDLAMSEMLHGYAHLRSNDAQTALKHFANGFWHVPAIPAARAIVPLMLETGALTPQNFLPITTIQRNLDRRRGVLKTLFSEFPAVIEGYAKAVPKTLPVIEVMVWDWAPLMRSVSFQALSRQGAVDRAKDLLEAMDPAPADRADYESQLAILQAFNGDLDAAEEKLLVLSGQDNADAMTWQRLSHARWLGRRFSKADAAAQRAVEIEPDWPVLQAWAGITALRARDAERALDHLTKAAGSLQGLPTVPFHLARALERLDRIDEAIAVVEQAVYLAPLDVEFSLLSAELLNRSGRSEEAIVRLMHLVEVQRAPGKLFVRLIDMLEQCGQEQLAAEMTSLAQTRLPKHPAFTEAPQEEAV